MRGLCCKLCTPGAAPHRGTCRKLHTRAPGQRTGLSWSLCLQKSICDRWGALLSSPLCKIPWLIDFGLFFYIIYNSKQGKICLEKAEERSFQSELSRCWFMSRNGSGLGERETGNFISLCFPWNLFLKGYWNEFPLKTTPPTNSTPYS